MEEMRWAVARRTVRRLLTSIEVYIAVQGFDRLSMSNAKQFCDFAAAHALATRTGRALGLQAGEAVFPVSLARSLDDSARKWAAVTMPARFATLCHPVVADLEHRDIVYRTKPRLVGIIYFPFTKGIIQNDIVPGLSL